LSYVMALFFATAIPVVPRFMQDWIHSRPVKCFALTDGSFAVYDSLRVFDLDESTTEGSWTASRSTNQRFVESLIDL
jgi:hypothetical protein